jgi:hypothetical protein
MNQPKQSQVSKLFELGVAHWLKSFVLLNSLLVMADNDIPNDPDVEKEVLDEGPRSILLGLISQLRKGMDLHRVTLPTFVLEPRSMLERVSDFMSHPDLILK